LAAGGLLHGHPRREVNAACPAAATLPETYFMLFAIRHHPARRLRAAPATLGSFRECARGAARAKSKGLTVVPASLASSLRPKPQLVSASAIRPCVDIEPKPRMNADARIFAGRSVMERRRNLRGPRNGNVFL